MDQAIISRDLRTLPRERLYSQTVAQLTDPTEPIDLIRLGEALTALGRVPEAVGVLRRALCRQRTDPQVRYQLAIAYAYGARPDWALKHLRRIPVEGNRDLHALVLSLSGRLYADWGRYRYAAQLADEAVEAAAGDEIRGRALARASYVRAAAGELPGALELAHQAVAIAPDQPATRFQLACVHASQGESTTAIELFRAATESDPEQVYYRFILADTLMARQDWKEAAAELSAALRLSPGGFHAEPMQLWLGHCLYELGCPVEAINAYEAAAVISRDPGSLGQSLADHLREPASSRRVQIGGVVPLCQKGDWCGPCSLAMALNAVGGGAVTQEALAPASLHEGLSFTGMVEAARRHGYVAEMTFGDMELLRRCLDAGLPVIIAASDAALAHYCLIIGYDDVRGALVLQDTDGGRPSICAARDLLQVWRRCGNWMMLAFPWSALPRPEWEAALAAVRAADGPGVALLTQFEGKAEHGGSGELAALACAQREACLSNPWLAQEAVRVLTAAGADEEVDVWLQQAERCFPEQSWPCTLQAWVLLRQDRIEEAARAVRAALAKEPWDWQARRCMSELYERQERWGLALRHARVAVQHVWSEPQARYTLARLLQIRGHWAAAVEHYAAAVELSPAEAWYQIWLILAYLELQRSADAAALLPGAEALVRDDADAWTHLGLAYERLQNFAAARRCHEKALALQPADVPARRSLAWVLLQQGHAVEAIQEYDRIAQYQPLEAPDWIFLGQVRESLKQYPEAVVAFRKAVELEPENPEAHLGLGRSLWLSREPGKALPCLERAEQLSPDGPSVLDHLGRLYLKLGQHRQAIPALTRRLQSRPNDAEIAGMLIDAYRRGVPALLVKLKHKLETGQALYWEQTLYVVGAARRGRPEEASRWAKLWLERVRDSGDALWAYWYVIILAMETGDASSAAALAEEALRCYPDDPRLRACHGLAIGLRGDFACAVQELMPLLERGDQQERVARDTVLFLIADDRTEEAADLAPRLGDPLLQWFLEGDYWAAALFSGLSLLLRRGWSIANRERLLAVRALALEKGGPLARWRARRVWQRLARGRTGFARLARQKLAID